MVEICQDVSGCFGCVRMCQDVSGLFRVCQDVSGYVRIVYVKMCQDVGTK